MHDQIVGYGITVTYPPKEQVEPQFSVSVADIFGYVIFTNITYNNSSSNDFKLPLCPKNSVLPLDR